MIATEFTVCLPRGTLANWNPDNVYPNNTSQFTRGFLYSLPDYPQLFLKKLDLYSWKGAEKGHLSIQLTQLERGLVIFHGYPVPVFIIPKHHKTLLRAWVRSFHLASDFPPPKNPPLKEPFSISGKQKFHLLLFV